MGQLETEKGRDTERDRERETHADLLCCSLNFPHATGKQELESWVLTYGNVRTYVGSPLSKPLHFIFLVLAM